MPVEPPFIPYGVLPPQSPESGNRSTIDNIAGAVGPDFITDQLIALGPITGEARERAEQQIVGSAADYMRRLQQLGYAGNPVSAQVAAERARLRGLGYTAEQVNGIRISLERPTSRTPKYQSDPVFAPVEPRQLLSVEETREFYAKLAERRVLEEKERMDRIRQADAERQREHEKQLAHYRELDEQEAREAARRSKYADVSEPTWNKLVLANNVKWLSGLVTFVAAFPGLTSLGSENSKVPGAFFLSSLAFFTGTVLIEKVVKKDADVELENMQTN